MPLHYICMLIGQIFQTVVCAHIQSGETPFYTISISQDREIQTEAGRLLRSIVVETADLAVDRIQCSSSDSLAMKQDLNNTDPLVAETIRRSEVLVSELCDNRVGSNSILDTEFVGTLIRIACGSQKISVQHKENFVAFVRGQCHVILKANKVDTPPELAFHRCNIAISLISSLVDSDYGLGYGLWLLSIFRFR
jgi:hypothetical protein